MLTRVVVSNAKEDRSCVLMGFGVISCGFCWRLFDQRTVCVGDECEYCGARVTKVDRAAGFAFESEIR